MSRGQITKEYAELFAEKAPLLMLFVKTILPLFAGRSVRALDVGCSHGINALPRATMIHEGGVRVEQLIGIDTDAVAIEQARQRIHTALFPAEFRVDDGRTLASVTDASVDLVTVERTLQHLAEDEIAATLRAIHRVLKPGGCVVAGGDPIWTTLHIEPSDPLATLIHKAILRAVATPDLNSSKLFSLFQTAGLVRPAVDVHPFPVYPWADVRKFFKIDEYITGLVGRNELTREAADAWLEKMEQADKMNQFKITLPFCITTARKLA